MFAGVPEFFVVPKDGKGCDRPHQTPPGLLVDLKVGRTTIKDVNTHKLSVLLPSYWRRAFALKVFSSHHPPRARGHQTTQEVH